jgi:hypothetical protein
MLMLEYLAQGEAEDFEKVLSYCCGEAASQHALSTKHASTINQFLIALFNVKDQLAANPMVSDSMCIHHHNYRTLEQPPGFGQLTHISYTAVRIESVCAVIKKVSGLIFKPEEVKRAVQECDFAKMSKGKFYDCSAWGFPITKVELDDEMREMRVPLPEAELLPVQLVTDHCAYFKTSDVNTLLNEVRTMTTPTVDFKQIVIKSAEDGEEYNFYDEILAGWYGARALKDNAFAEYCGLNNEIAIRDELKVHIECDVDEVNYFYRPSQMAKIYGHSPVDAPSIYAHNPFEFGRNQTPASSPKRQKTTPNSRSSGYHSD